MHGVALQSLFSVKDGLGPRLRPAQRFMRATTRAQPEIVQNTNVLGRATGECLEKARDREVRRSRLNMHREIKKRKNVPEVLTLVVKVIEDDKEELRIDEAAVTLFDADPARVDELETVLDTNEVTVVGMVLDRDPTTLRVVDMALVLLELIVFDRMVVEVADRAVVGRSVILG